MLDTNDNILFPNATPDIEEQEPIEQTLDELEAPEFIMEAEEKATIEEQESYAIEYDTDLTDDSDDFRDADLHLNAEF